MLNTPFALCPKCTSNIPSLSINKRHIDTLSINCACGYTSNMPLHIYLTHYNRFKVKSTSSPLCKKHNRLCCKKCSKHSKNTNLIDKDFFNNAIEKISNHITNYITPLCTHALGILTKLKREIEMNYTRTVSQCKDISEFIRVLSENYVASLNDTVEAHCDLWLYKCSDENCVRSINAYFKTFSLYEKPLELVSFSATSKCTNISIKSMISLSDGRIAVHDEDTIYIGRYGTRRDIKFDIEIRHNNTINSLCKLDNDNILACGAMTIDVYNDTYKKIAEISTEESINKVLAIANERFVVCCEQSIFVYLNNETHPMKKIPIDLDPDATAITYIKEKNLIVIYSDDKLTLCSMTSYQIVSVFEVDIDDYDDDSVHVEVVDKERVMIVRNLKLVMINVIEGRKEFEIEDSKIGSITAMRRLNERYLVCACKSETEFRKGNYWEIKFLIVDWEMRKYTMSKCEQDEIIKEIVRIDDREMMTTNGHSIDIWKGE